MPIFVKSFIENSIFIKYNGLHIDLDLFTTYIKMVRSKTKIYVKKSPMLEKFKAWLRREPLLLDWIQVEVTSYCNAQCIYCPRTIYKANWIDRHLDINTFQRLIPFLENTKLVYLQGWGEPFLNPSLFEMIDTSKAKGCMVGLTSNALVIDTKIVEKIIKSGVDIIALSLTGDAKSNDFIRKKTKYEKVISVIGEFKRLKNIMQKNNPIVNIAYLLFDKDMTPIYQLIDRTEGLGVSHIVVSGLDFIASDSLLCHAVHFTQDEINEINQLKEYANQKGVKVITNLLYSNKPRKVCTENVTNSLYMSSDGSISPCVYLNLPIGESLVNYHAQTLTTYKRHIIGSIKEKSLVDIWFSKEYSIFRMGFVAGNHAKMCKSCLKLYISDVS